MRLRFSATVMIICAVVALCFGAKPFKGGSAVVKIDIAASAKMDFVKIKPGIFMMGSEKGEKEEKPVRKVTFAKEFYMGVYEVMQSQWEAVMGGNPSNFKGPKNPVEQVTWAESQEFVQKLSKENAKWSFRLPTEAEWEYVAKAGTTSPYFFDDTDSTLSEYAWFAANSKETTHPVGEKKPNPWGLYDIYGNVWEWVQDADHGNYEGAPTDGSAWDKMGGMYHIVRGGSWDDPPNWCRSGARPQYYPAEKSIRYGFRVVAAPK